MNLLKVLKRMKELVWVFDVVYDPRNIGENTNKYIIQDNHWSDGVKVYRIPSILEVEDDIVRMAKESSIEFATLEYYYRFDIDEHCYELNENNDNMFMDAEDSDRLLSCCMLWIKVKEKDNE